MRRLYFIAPNIDSAKKILDDLLLARVDDHHIHIVGKDEAALIRAHLPAASLLEKSDIVPAFERGLVVGFATGLTLSLLAFLFPPVEFSIGGGALLGITLFGAGFGAWISSMIGVSLHNSHLKNFEEAIESGELLFIVDVPKKRMAEIRALMKSHHPEAENKGSDPTIPAFP